MVVVLDPFHNSYEKDQGPPPSGPKVIESTPENRLVAAKTNLIFVKKEREIAICMTTNRVIC